MQDPATPPLAEAYPRDMWRGPLRTRVKRFLGAHPRRARLVENVRFAWGEDAQQSAARPLLVLSLEGISETELRALTRDYLRAFSHGLVGHPVPEAGTHLYVRLGARSFDYNPVYRAQDFAPRVGSREAIEPLVQLVPEEEKRLRLYARQTSLDPAGMLGDPSYAGATSGLTRAELHDNRPLDPKEQHNCTSWICTAPIGARGEAYLELTGAERAKEVHTNPGWWLNHLLSRAPSERVPLAVLWSQKKLPAALRGVAPGKVLNWDFNYK